MTAYTLDASRYREHLVAVTYEFVAPADNPAVWLPTWVPGSYLIREFARHIGRVSAHISTCDTQPSRADDTHIPSCQKLNKNTWRVPAKAGDAVRLDYEVYCFDLSVRGSYVDQTRLYGNFATLCVVARGLENDAITLKLKTPKGFEDATLACSLPTKQLKKSYKLSAPDYNTLIDHPFELAAQDAFEFSAGGIKHQFVISGRHHADLERLKTDLEKICAAYIALFGEAPFSNYLFMTMATGSDYGGLEHENCTSLITPRHDLPSVKEPKTPSKNYRRFLGLCSHEYFHAWLVKKIRPKNMLEPNLHGEVYTELLWVFEGFTSYFDDLMLYRSGVISEHDYLQLLSDQINRYLQTHGRAHQSAAESSFDAWIKLYRSDENTANAGISYYNKGALIALCLDLTLKQHDARLDDVVRALYEQAKAGKGVTNQQLDSIIAQLAPAETWQRFKDDYVHGVAELPIAELLTQQGVTVKPKQKDWSLGMIATQEHGALTVKRVLRGSSAANAGISAKDVLVAIDGIKASTDVLKRYAHLEREVTCHFFRRDELMHAHLKADNTAIESLSLTFDDADKDKLLSWLKP